MTSDIFTRLRAPFPPDRVSWRVGATTGDKSKGMALAYIDARDVMERLDEVCGPQSWQCRYPHANGKTVCEIGICVGTSLEPKGEWIWKADGAGDTDHEAEKGALSDAFKRAAVRWGIGRYLYDLDSPWVKIEQRGKSYVIAQSEYAVLRRVLGDTSRTPPANEQREEPAPSVEFYAAAFRRRLDQARKASDVRDMWKTDVAMRDKLGITAGHPMHATLHSEWVARGKELAAKEAA